MAVDEKKLVFRRKQVGLFKIGNPDDVILFSTDKKQHYVIRSLRAFDTTVVFDTWFESHLLLLFQIQLSVAEEKRGRVPMNSCYLYINNLDEQATEMIENAIPRK